MRAAGSAAELSGYNSGNGFAKRHNVAPGVVLDELPDENTLSCSRKAQRKPKRHCGFALSVAGVQSDVTFIHGLRLLCLLLQHNYIPPQRKIQ